MKVFKAEINLHHFHSDCHNGSRICICGWRDRLGVLFFTFLLQIDWAEACLATRPTPFPPSPPVPPPFQPFPPQPSSLPPQQPQFPPQPAPPICCLTLAQTLSSAGFQNGAMTLIYNSAVCPTVATATCTAPNPSNLVAAIMVNQNHFLSASPSAVTYTAICNPFRQWSVGSPPLIVNNIECVLTTEPLG